MLPTCLTRFQLSAVASAFLFTALPAVAAQPAAPVAAPASALPTVQAQTWALYDPVASKMLASYEADKRIIPASLTKVLTGYIVSEALHEKKLSPDQMVNVSLNAYKVDKASSKMYIDPKVPVNIKDLLYGLII